MELEQIQKLNKDLKTAAKILSDQEARYLVDTYYQMQDFRKATANQVRVMKESNEPHMVLGWFLWSSETLESELKKALGYYVKNHPIGQWLNQISGIGPVIAAGLLAHIDITKAPTVGHIWSFAGLDPKRKWEKGQKRPWNAELKTLCWKIGQSFVKVCNKENDIYGKLYKERKAYEQAKNEAMEYKEQAEYRLAHCNFKKTTEAYKWYVIGKLPPGHIQQRAERYAVKIFLSHLHQYWYEKHYGVPAPQPFAIAILGHAHIIKMPEFEEVG